MYITEAQAQAVAQAFPDEFPRYLESMEFEDAALECLLNEAREVVTRYDIGSAVGPYPLSIHGVPGAYYVHLFEAGPDGVYSTLAEAERALDAATITGLFDSYGEALQYMEEEETR